jgi:hypothetical protein
MWLALKSAPDAITVRLIVEVTGCHRETVQRYLKALTASGHLEYTPAPAGGAAQWKLVNDVGHHAPRVRADGSKVTQGAITGQLWGAMLGLKKFDFLELVQTVPVEVPEATAKDYCKRLLAAGYLRVLVKADPSAGRIARYELIRRSGPKAPQVQRVRQVYDPNTGAVYPVGGGA